jgi:hypothetical protein
MSSSISQPRLGALKERAGVVNALLDGVQTVLVGGSGLDPEECDNPFALYPAYSHQNPDRYSPHYERYYHISTTKPDAGIPLRGVARLVEEYEIDTDDVPELGLHYVYSVKGLRDKYGIEDDTDARTLLLRNYEFHEPRLIEERPTYRGCRSWINLDSAIDVDVSAATPVLDDAAFAERRAAIQRALEE